MNTPPTQSELRVQGLAEHVSKGNHKAAMECILREKQGSSRIALISKLVHFIQTNRSHFKKGNDEFKPIIEALLKVQDIDSAVMLAPVLSQSLRKQADAEIDAARETLAEKIIAAIRSKTDM
ncbi:MAG: hypothetical protein JWO73_722 [Candidatus Taylorbacteria bacterium]|nr:hypothetical protein [Candidatus Taylorbacteria bacterium]